MRWSPSVSNRRKTHPTVSTHQEVKIFLAVDARGPLGRPLLPDPPVAQNAGSHNTVNAFET